MSHDPGSAAEPFLRLEGVGVAYGSRVALQPLDLTVAAGSIVAVLGPSGSGKSSLLRVVAGLEPPTGGRITLDGRDITGVPAHDRGIGLMFQDFALFPHRDVAGNVGFGLRMRGDDAAAVARRVMEVLELVGLPGAGPRSVGALSGGEQQRVALARALAPEPRLLMLDEPMGSLDRALRERLPAELRAIALRLGLTVLYVTHDQEEAFGVADRVVILRDGRVVADGTPEGLWTSPPDAFVASFLGFRNIADAEVSGGVARTPWGTLALPGVVDGRVTLVLRPDALGLADTGMGGVVEARRFRGDHVRVVVTTDAGAPLELEVRDGPLPQVGERVRVAVDPARVNVLAAG
ncbi:MAG: ABC transporter ATP-binding protein [Candidatus Limnocylindrales bacterium]